MARPATLDDLALDAWAADDAEEWRAADGARADEPVGIGGGSGGGGGGGSGGGGGGGGGGGSGGEWRVEHRLIAFEEARQARLAETRQREAAEREAHVLDGCSFRPQVHSVYRPPPPPSAVSGLIAFLERQLRAQRLQREREAVFATGARYTGRPTTVQPFSLSFQKRPPRRPKPAQQEQLPARPKAAARLNVPRRQQPASIAAQRRRMYSGAATDAPGPRGEDGQNGGETESDARGDETSAGPSGPRVAGGESGGGGESGWTLDAEAMDEEAILRALRVVRALQADHRTNAPLWPDEAATARSGDGHDAVSLAPSDLAATQPPPPPSPQAAPQSPPPLDRARSGASSRRGSGRNPALRLAINGLFERAARAKATSRGPSPRGSLSGDAAPHAQSHSQPPQHGHAQQPSLDVPPLAHLALAPPPDEEPPLRHFRRPRVALRRPRVLIRAAEVAQHDDAEDEPRLEWTDDDDDDGRGASKERKEDKSGEVAMPPPATMPLALGELDIGEPLELP
jgi:hypothetical protein